MVVESFWSYLLAAVEVGHMRKTSAKPWSKTHPFWRERQLGLVSRVGTHASGRGRVAGYMINT